MQIWGELLYRKGPRVESVRQDRTNSSTESKKWYRQHPPSKEGKTSTTLGHLISYIRSAEYTQHRGRKHQPSPKYTLNSCLIGMQFR